MKTMMKWLVGISCAMAFIAIAFTPSNAVAQYACRPVSRIGPQSIEGPLTLTCSACVGGAAITIPSGSKICLDGATCAANFYNLSGVPRTDTLSVGTLMPGNIILSGSIYNTSANNGGSVPFNDPTRWLSTTTALLESSTAATAGVDTVFALNALNSMDNADILLALRNAGGDAIQFFRDGHAVFSGMSVGGNTLSWIGAQGFMQLKGNVADGATAVNVRIGNANALTTAGAKILNLYSDNMTTERAYFDYLGGLHFVTTKWDDLLVPMSTAKAAGVRAPGFEYFVKNTGGTSTGVFGYAFDSAATEELFFTAQLPHSYKEGTAIKPHVHWSPKTAGTGDVKFELECTKATIDGTFAATSTITATAAASGQLKHQLTTMTDISGTGLGISSVIMCRIARLGGDAADTYGADVFIHDVDFHYEIDSVGSSTSTAK